MILDILQNSGVEVKVFYSPAWSNLRQMEPAEFFSFLEKQNIYQWNQLLAPSGLSLDIPERNALLHTLRDYYEQVFRWEERRSGPSFSPPAPLWSPICGCITTTRSGRLSKASAQNSRKLTICPPSRCKSAGPWAL